MPTDSNPEEIELDIKVRVKVAEANIEQFNASFVSLSTLPIVENRLKEIRDLYNQTNSIFFKFEVVHADSTSIESLRKLVKGLGNSVAANEKAVMEEVAKLYPDNGITEDKSSAVAPTESKASRSIDCPRPSCVTSIHFFTRTTLRIGSRTGRAGLLNVRRP